LTLERVRMLVFHMIFWMYMRRWSTSTGVSLPAQPPSRGLS